MLTHMYIMGDKFAKKMVHVSELSVYSLSITCIFFSNIRGVMFGVCYKLGIQGIIG